MTTSVDPTIPHFFEAFCDNDYNGIQVIDQKIKNSKATSEEIKMLYEIRAQIEGDYGDRLLKLSQLIVGKDEDGSLAESLSHIPSALETTARAHIDLAQQLQHHLQSPLDTFINEQYELYISKQQRINEIVNSRNETYDNFLRTKGAYTSECAKLNEINKYLTECKPSPEELNQAEKDRQACIKNIEVQEKEYKLAIGSYNETTKLWLNEWKLACDVYQQMEEKRIRFVRSSLWAFANMMSSVYIVDDQCCERIRTALELTDIDKDIHTFVKDNATTQSIPTFVEFEDVMPKYVPELIANAANGLENDDSKSISNRSISQKSISQKSISQKSLPPAPAVIQNEQQPIKKNGIVYYGVLDDDEDDEDEDDYNHINENDNIKNDQIVPESISSNQEPNKSQESISQIQQTPQNQQQNPENQQNSEDKPVSDATTFALKAVETMFVENELLNNSSQSLNLTEHKLPSEQIPSNQSEQRNIQPNNNNNSRPVSIAGSSSNTPLLENQNSKPSSFEQRRFKPVPNPAFQNQESLSIHSKGSHNGSLQQQYEHQSNVSPSIKNTLESTEVSAVALASTHPVDNSNTNTNDINNDNQIKKVDDDKDQVKNNDDNNQIKNNNENNYDSIKKDDKKNIKDDLLLTDDESEDGYKAPVRPPPKDEKWVISSIRRPQMVPVRSQNARMYNGSINQRSSTMKTNDSTLEQQQQLPIIDNDHPNSSLEQHPEEHSPDSHSSGKLNRPHPPLKIEIPKVGTKEAAQEAIAVGRAHTQQQHQQQQQYQQPIQNDTIGIRPPPWQQDGLSSHTNGSQQLNMPYNSYDPSSTQHNQRYSHQPYISQQQQQQQQGLNRYGSVNGPRVAPEKITGGIDNDNSYGKNSKNNGLEFGKFMKGVLKSNDGRPLSTDASNIAQENKKEKGGRFSLAIFSNKKDKDKKVRESTLGHRPPVQGDVFISGPPGGGPVMMDNNNNNNNMNNNNNNSNLNSSSESYIENKNIPNIPINQQHQQQQSPSQYQQNYNASSVLQSNSPNDNHLPSGPGYASDGAPILHYARAVWPFTATIPSEMSFNAGDRVAIVKKQSDGWWDAELQGPNPIRGLVPGNYMEIEP